MVRFAGLMTLLSTWLLTLLSLVVMTQQAQAAYTVEEIAGTPFDSTSTNVTWTNNSSLTAYPQDDDFALVNIGFSFYLGETAYTQVRILSNGALHFGSDQGFYKDYTNESLPITSDCSGNCPGYEEPADRVILGYWDDLEPSLGGSITYDTLGSGSDRRFVATWDSVPRYNGPSTAYSVQIVLYETGEVLFRYGDDDATGTSATIGIEVDDSDFLEFSHSSERVSDALDLYWVREFPAIASVSASCTDFNTVTVQFDAAVQPPRATNTANYSIDNGITITSATLVDSTTVELTTSTLSAGTTYTLSTTYPDQNQSFILTTGAVSGTIADNFNTRSYSNNSGDLSWGGNWQEENDYGSYSSGDILISGSRLLFDDDDGDGPSIYRTVDLSPYDSVTLTFDYYTQGSLESNDRFAVQVSTNGGVSYTTVASYSNDTSGSESINLTSYISSSTRIRFIVTDGYGGSGEFMNIDNVAIDVSGAGAACVNPLVGLWRMESGPWDGTSGEVLDSSGNGLNGRTVGGASSLGTSPAIAGDPGTCDYANFNGSTQYLEVADDDLLDLSDELTITAWVYPNALPGSGLMSILSKDENYEFHITPGGEINWWWNDDSGTTREFDSVGANITPDNWYHIAVSYTSGSQVIYVNGVQRATRTYTGTLRTNSDPLQIGQDQVFPGRYFNGRIDEVRIYNSALDSTEINDLYAETHDCPSCTLGGFAISQPSYGLACPDTRAEIEIRAMCDDGVTTHTTYAGIVDLSSNENSLSEFYSVSSGGSEISSITFDGSENGDQNVYLYHKNENPNVEVTATDRATGVDGTAASGTDFRSSGFSVTSSADNFACGNSVTLTVRAVGQDPDGGASCTTLSGFDGSKNLKAWYEVNVHPTESPGEADTVSTSMVIGGNSISAQDKPSADGLTLDFNSGVATASLAYADSGEILGVNFIHDEAPYDGSVTGLGELEGSTSSIIIAKPQRLSVSVNTVDSDCASGDATCTKFVPAGDAFSMTVAAVCTDASVAESYLGTVDLNHSLSAPVGGASGILSIQQPEIVSSDNGSKTITDQKYDEVGVITLQALPVSDYFGQTVGSSSIVTVGRFYPAYLGITANVPEFEPPHTCGFTYQDQAFGYLIAPELTITAYNRNGGITSNYDSSFFKLTDPALSYVNNNATDRPSEWDEDTSGRVYSFKSGTPFDGVRELEINGDMFTHQKTNMTPASQDDPFEASVDISFSAIALTDSDGVCYQSGPNTGTCLPLTISNVGGTQIRYGRLRMENAFGPETDPLTAPMQVEYWDGDNFVVNDADDCTTYTTDNTWITMQNYTDNLDDGETKLEIDGSSGTTEGFVKGGFDYGNSKHLYLTAPGLGNDGSVELAPSVDVWLQYDWDGDGNLDNPTSRATFGQYRGHDRIIYWREVVN